MRGIFFKTIFLAALFLNLSCTSSSKQEESLVNGDTSKNFDDKMNANLNWQKNMQNLEKTMVELYPLVLNPAEFESQKNHQKIHESLKRLEATSRQVNHSPITMMNDPSLALISFDFRKQIHDVERAFDDGKKNYARFELLKLSQYCIECHTQTNKGPNFGYSQYSQKIQTLPLLVQAEMYVASRRFNEALKIYEDFFKQESVDWESQFKTEMVLHNSMAILIRFKRDPKATLDFLAKAEKAAFIPLYVKNVIQVWKKDIKKWSEEIKTLKPSITLVKIWIDRSNSRVFEHGRLGAQVWNQLAISYLHEFLENTSFKQYKSEALWLLGGSYINGVNSYQSSLGEKYLELCIQVFPNSVSAHRCYFKLEEYVYDTNSGTGGSFLSIEEKERLRKLKELSEPK